MQYQLRKATRLGWCTVVRQGQCWNTLVHQNRWCLRAIGHFRHTTDWTCVFAHDMVWLLECNPIQTLDCPCWNSGMATVNGFCVLHLPNWFWSTIQEQQIRWEHSWTSGSMLCCVQSTDRRWKFLDWWLAILCGFRSLALGQNIVRQTLRCQIQIFPEHNHIAVQKIQWYHLATPHDPTQ